MCPIVNIIYSEPTQNTQSQRWVLLQNLPPAVLHQQVINNGETLDHFHHFALLNNLDHNSIIWIPMNNTSLYQFQYAGEGMIEQWRMAKKERVRKRKQIDIRKKADKAAKLHRMLNKVLWQSHKLMVDGRGQPLQWWPVVPEWEEAVALAKIKKGGVVNSFTD